MSGFVIVTGAREGRGRVESPGKAGRSAIVDHSRCAVSALPEGSRPGNCVNCGTCLKKCPQKTAIPEHMKEIVRELK
ncbi:MAG: hypothetical protein IJU70_10580 [Lentisphaeria bacterium]|nr:hypothetical protein [Lentisphaeria bacterium]